MSKNILVMAFHGLVWAGVIAFAFWATGANAGAARYDSATPYTPPYTKYKYIPLHNEPDDVTSLSEEEAPSSGMPPSEMILTALRTALDVVRNMNKNRLNTPAIARNSNSTSVKHGRRQSSNDTISGRGFEDYYDEHHDHHHEVETTTAKPMKQGRYTDPWAGYYDWIINEGSFKFWSVFQLFTAALLLYACFSAIYYAKFNPILPDYSLEYDDYFLERSVGRKARSLDPSEMLSGLSWINPSTFQFILNAIAKHYEDQ
ncbi:unnamed protein product [Pieris macdunnoughi]|uniref:Uncharacterized protein n=1 Tax=Pieris macdunnoughi TaxID=345717 RepID=A0A821NWN3_9NEOP|nr:unnamed protein product [Pieris macdunnoughi]